MTVGIWVILGVIILGLLISLTRSRGHGHDHSVGTGGKPMPGAPELMKQEARADHGVDEGRKSSGHGCGGCC